VQELKQAGIKVWIVQQVPLQKVTNPKLELARSLFRGIPLSKGISIDAHIEGNRAANAAIRSVIEARGDLSLIDPAEYCFDEDGFATLFTAEGLYYQDNNHVSPLGAERLLRPMMELLFQEIIRPAGDAKAVDPFLPGNSD
jgi:hypothetical protein